MNALPSAKNLVSVAILAISLIAAYLVATHSGHQLQASTTATLDNDYTEVTSDHGTSKHYDVKYGFEVNKVPYRGTDTLYTLPTSEKQRVYYNPKNPADNSLSENPPDGMKIAIAIGLFIVGVIAYNTLPVNPAKSVPAGAMVGLSGVGDAAGEYLTMNGGRYPASFYVGIAFFGQVAFTSLFSAPFLYAFTGGHLGSDLIGALAILCGLGITLLIYWDRWKCNAVFSSKFCSGCANISAMYVPIIAFWYANWRGLKKLVRR